GPGLQRTRRPVGLRLCLAVRKSARGLSPQLVVFEAGLVTVGVALEDPVADLVVFVVGDKVDAVVALSDRGQPSQAVVVELRDLSRLVPLRAPPAERVVR